MADVTLQITSVKNVFGAKPFIPERAEAASFIGLAGVAGGKSLLLKLGPKGPLGTWRVFDNKISGQSDF